MFYGDSVKDEIEKRKNELKEKEDGKFSWFSLQKSSAIEKESSGLCDVEVHARNQKQSQNEVMNQCNSISLTDRNCFVFHYLFLLLYFHF